MDERRDAQRIILVRLAPADIPGLFPEEATRAFEQPGAVPLALAVVIVSRMAQLISARIERFSDETICGLRIRLPLAPAPQT